MPVQRSVSARNAALDGMETGFGSGAKTIELRTGVPPANCAAADTGTVLATISVPDDFMAAASGGSKSGTGMPWTDPSADATGRCGHYRLKNGATCHDQGLVTDNWRASWPYAVGDQVNNDSGKVYRVTAGGTSAGSGGPTGTGGSITDGGVTWTYVETGTILVLSNASIVAAQPVSIDTYVWTAGGA